MQPPPTADRPRPFLVLTFPRCGTHMLRTMLDGHPRIRCRGEVFNPNHPDGRHGLTDSSTIVSRGFESDGHSAAIGFCVHYYRTWSSAPTRAQRQWPSLWEHLPRLLPDGVTILFLRRENLLRRLVSLEVARRTRQWTRTPGMAARHCEPFPIEVDHLRSDVERLRKLEADVRERFPQCVELVYESLAQGTRDLSGVQDRLGVERRALTPRTIRQARPLGDVVSNLSELRRALGGTEIEPWFDAD